MSNQEHHSLSARAVHFKPLKVTSPAFRENDMIPSDYTCDGLNISPALDIDNIPEETTCLALVVEDPDAPAGTWVHWVAWNIPVSHHIKKNDLHGVEGINDFNGSGYGGPCPPSGTHRYFFKVYALDALLDIPANSTKSILEKTMSDHIIGFGQLTGKYRRKK